MPQEDTVDSDLTGDETVGAHPESGPDVIHDEGDTAGDTRQKITDVLATEREAPDLASYLRLNKRVVLSADELKQAHEENASSDPFPRVGDVWSEGAQTYNLPPSPYGGVRSCTAMPIKYIDSAGNLAEVLLVPVKIGSLPRGVKEHPESFFGWKTLLHELGFNHNFDDFPDWIKNCIVSRRFSRGEAERKSRFNF